MITRSETKYIDEGQQEVQIVKSEVKVIKNGMKALRLHVEGISVENKGKIGVFSIIIGTPIINTIIDVCFGKDEDEFDELDLIGKKVIIETIKMGRYLKIVDVWNVEEIISEEEFKDFINE